jgi:hypothetical protein
MSRRLLIINPDQCIEVQFDQQITIGRDVFNSLSLQDPELSRSHAIIFEQDEEMIVKDLNSRNGIFVNGERVTEGLLDPGDEIIMGSTVMIYDPSETLDLGMQLSKRGKFLVEKRQSKQPQKPEPATSFSCREMDKALTSMFHDAEATRFLTLEHAVQMLQVIKEMDDAADTADLFKCTMRRVIEILGGERGVIMETDDQKQHLKVRAIQSIDNSETILIGQPILRMLLGQEKCLFCANTRTDARFAKVTQADDKPVRTFVACPILSNDELFGFIYLDAEEGSLTYDYTALRTLYLVATHLGSLLKTWPMHFPKHAPRGHETPAPAS